MKSRFIAVLLLLVSLISILLSSCSKVEFRVNFIVEGEVYDSISTNGSEVIKMPVNPEKENYTFDGWYWDKDVWSKPFTANSILDVPLSDDMSVYAKFIPNDIPPVESNNTKVLFIVDGALYFTVNTDGSKIIEMPDNPTKENCSFDGWYWDKDIWSQPFTANSLLDTPLSSDMAVYAKFVTNATPPNEAYITNGLNEIPNIVDIAAATEYNDPNGQLNKAGGYIADIFFSLDIIEQSNISGITLIEKGTIAGGSIEVYTNIKDAEKRNTYLSTFDGTILASGSHKVVGTCVIRTSSLLTASLQRILENNLEMLISGSSTQYVSMDNYLIEIATKIANDNKLSPAGTISKLIEMGYPENKAALIVGSIKVDFDTYAAEFAEKCLEEYAAIYPSMLEEILYNEGYLESNVIYALSNANIDWLYFATIYASDYLNEYEEDFVAPMYPIAYLMYELGYTFEAGEYALTQIDYDWDTQALLALKWFIEQRDVTPNHSECYGYLAELLFSDSQITYAINNYDGLIYPDNLYYSISFETDGGILSNTTLNVEFGTTYTLPTPVKSGYTFIGWFNGDSEIKNGIWYIDKDITVTARWEKTKFKINYVLDEGINNGNNPCEYTISDTINLLLPSRTGYTFLGWQLSFEEGDDILSSTIPEGTIGDITCTALWKVNQYTITFITDGGSTIAPITLDYGARIIKPSNPTKTGYKFSRWDQTIPSYMPAENITVTAIWVIQQYTITFITDGGTTINPITQNYGTTIVKPSNPTKTGYTFIGWDETIPTAMPGENITITAVWKPKQYTITFKTDGGTCSISSSKVTYDSYYAMPTATREGYIFDGWYNGSTKYTSGTWTKASSIVLTAKWTPQTYTVTYNPDGGNLGSTKQILTFDAAYTLYIPSKTGYKFEGWYNGDKKVENGTWTTAEDITLKAKWTPNTYTVLFEANGGTCSTTVLIATYDSEITLPNPSRVGYTFSGWYSGKIRYYSGIWDTAESVELTAKWTPKSDIPYTINHYQQTIDDGYELVETQELKGTADISIIPSRKTYTGFTSPAGQCVTISPDGTLVVDYYYTRNNYTITFISNGGKEVSSLTQKYGSAISLPITEKDDFTFGGWYSDAGFKTKFTSNTMPSSNTKIFARWIEEASPYDFEYDEDLSKISKYVGTSSVVIVPSHIGGIEVTTINSWAFSGCLDVTKVVIPNTVTNIGEHILSGCINLEELVIPFVKTTMVLGNSYQIGMSCLFNYWFDGSGYDMSLPEGTYDAQTYNHGGYTPTGDVGWKRYAVPLTLKKITITDTDFIPDNAFYGFEHVEEIVILGKPTQIGERAFYNCEQLKALEMDTSSLSSIGVEAFQYCRILPSIYLSTSVKTVGKWAFYGCTNLVIKCGASGKPSGWNSNWNATNCTVYWNQ